jgi:hypothetical protein
MSPRQLNAEDAKVVLSLRMRLDYRNKLARIASESRVSLNQLMLEAIERSFPPDVADSGD